MLGMLNGKVNDAELQQFLTDYDFARTHECITDATLQTKLADKEKEMVTKIITDLSLATTSEQENVLEAVISEIKTKLDKTPPAQAEQKPTTELIEKVKDYISDIKNVENIQDIRTLIATQHQVMKQKVDNEVERNKKPPVEYSLYGSRLMFDYVNIENEVEEEELKRIVEQQIQIKNSSNFYQEAPFLTIAEDLLKLIKEDKIEQIIFLVYCKVLGVKEDEVIRDERIEKIFKETFGKFSNCSLEKINYVEDDGGGVEIQWSKTD
ncbi:11827_t:CDS:2 [Funneliformis geosporum]|uniref:2172_t:CDS:1 n=1 Tax=Funneliformis geosporum TaxID=1117311 RepID=A0A9W4T6L7_9GLOM|nr:11827_t:CDS:2 [Funneliformis geosporum]CAI2193750.1 2172_t:CDS:2 [Funneliformis geosporum]